MLDLLRGRQPLERALWVYAILYGTLLNLVATLAGLLAAAAGAPDWLAVGLFLLPLPYSLAALLGVWRSAGRPGVAAARAASARLIVAVWAVAMLVV
ncbi:hypothetical protein SAMN06265365_107142 [Tistlia consotensis]|uniref:Uncharacterized protein n=1 Tax=Tistlia consotensis USBA 355 TaxID=560819 RepID=A0A1Y6BDC8_9PROT|nr:hypothetical protein [Tistlia consotensis]SME98104.1 hypothetical protein SAMN05428998_102144 [Tistlia consotensis USBA 355]SNR57503.1 hypothetical protein SAMN06265365_107142 [Tistlia consotensis]